VGKGHRLAERRHAILTVLKEAGQLSVGELSSRFDVSEVTIRMDLQALSQQNLLMRSRGGAVAISALPELSFDIRQQQYSDKKSRIGKAAAQMIQPGDTIGLDASTTAMAIVPHIHQHSQLTVVSNSLKIAMSLLRVPHVQVIMPGGYLRRESLSIVGQKQDDLIEDIHMRIGFFGAWGISPEHGMTDINLEEVRTKKRMVSLCQVVVGIVDSRKWGQVAAATFANMNQVNVIITDHGAPAEMVAQLRAMGVEVLVV
jgi:DeoR family transcriptional regulator, aga operon transcriptional repressor